MTLSDGLLIVATLASPLIAVQVTRYLDDRKERMGRKLRVFKTLMATRAYSLSAAHVEALNSIDLEFSIERRRERQVIEVWRQYLDLLGDKSISPEQWHIRRVDLLVELLYAMGSALGYDFDKTQLKNGTYSPSAHGRIEDEQQTLRTMTLELMHGKRALPVFVANIPAQSPPPPPSEG